MISMASSERSLTPDQRSPSENHDAPLGTFCLLFCNVFHFVTAFSRTSTKCLLSVNVYCFSSLFFHSESRDSYVR